MLGYKTFISTNGQNIEIADHSLECLHHYTYISNLEDTLFPNQVRTKHIGKRSQFVVLHLVVFVQHHACPLILLHFV